jgi:hypothetical protein
LVSIDLGELGDAWARVPQAALAGFAERLDHIKLTRHAGGAF